MTKVNEFLRRADRAAAIALVLVLATATGAASVGNHPPTYHQHANNPYAVHSVARLQPVSLRGPETDVDVVPAVAYQASSAVQALPSASELALARFADEQRCLAEAMYYEARGEGVKGEEAIAEVVFHRLHRRGYPGSICGVVYQGAGEGASCQFSFVCNGEMRRPKTPGAWAQARLLAAKILSGYMLLGNATGGATSFHAVDVEPDWSASLERTVQIGNHVFYRPLARTHAS